MSIKRDIVIGDVHGNLLELNKLLNKLQLTSTDKLIFLGDYIDGHPFSFEVIELLIELKAKHETVFIRGNHDCWMEDVLNSYRDKLISGSEKYIFNTKEAMHYYDQGGLATYNSYQNFLRKPENNALIFEVLQTHYEFFRDLKYYHIENNNAFVHGGFQADFYLNIEEQYHLDKHGLLWDRSLYKRARHLQHLIDKGYNVGVQKAKFGNYNHIFIGHTSTTEDDKTNLYQVHKCCNIINMDTGAGGFGPLSAYIIQEDKIINSK